MKNSPDKTPKPELPRAKKVIALAKEIINPPEQVDILKKLTELIANDTSYQESLLELLSELESVRKHIDDQLENTVPIDDMTEEQICTAYRQLTTKMSQTNRFLLEKVLKLKLSELLNRLHSLRDPLTGLLSRGALMEEEIPRIVSDILRHGRGVSVFLIDIDHFKNVNDSLGHEKGDIILRKIAEIIHEHLRESDVCGRLGGEEFLIVSPDTTSVDMYNIAERIRKSVEEAKLLQETTLPSLTVSIGCSRMEVSDVESLMKVVGDKVQQLAQKEKMTMEVQRKERNQTLLQLFPKGADRAMYKAKKEGRNRIAVLPFEK